MNLLSVSPAGLIAAIALLVVAGPLGAQETTPLEAKFAVPKPLLIVPPDYPARALAKKRTAEIEVRGTVAGDGTFELAAFSNGPGEEDFVEAVRTVLNEKISTRNERDAPRRLVWSRHPRPVYPRPAYRAGVEGRRATGR